MNGKVFEGGGKSVLNRITTAYLLLQYTSEMRPFQCTHAENTMWLMDKAHMAELIEQASKFSASAFYLLHVTCKSKYAAINQYLQLMFPLLKVSMLSINVSPLKSFNVVN